MLKVLLMFIFNIKYVRMIIGPVWKYVSPIYNYISEIFAAISQLTNTMLFGNRDQTFAARCHEGAVLKITWLVWMERLLNAIWSGIELGHCKKTFDSDSERSYSTDSRLSRFEDFKREIGIRD